MPENNYTDGYAACPVTGGMVLIRCTKIGKEGNFSLSCKGADGNTKWKKCPSALQSDCLMVTMHRKLEDVIKKEKEKRRDGPTISLLSLLELQKRLQRVGKSDEGE